MVVLAATLFFCLFIIRTVTNNYMKIGICLLAILYCIPFAIPTTILFDIELKIQISGPIVSIVKGNATSLSIGALICAIIIILLTGIILGLHKVDLE